MKLRVFNSLLMLAAIGSAYLPIRAMPNQRPLPAARLPLSYRAVELAPGGGPLKLVAAWEVETGDRRFGGLSALAIDDGHFVAVSDRGSVTRFDRPAAQRPSAWLADLRQGPGRFGKKWARDAESFARDPNGRGWWIAYEQNHSLWLYDDSFQRTLASVELGRGWRANRGAEGLLIEGDHLLVTAENGRDAIRVGRKIERLPLDAGADVADAARAPDGSAWLLLRSKGLDGISQSIAPLVRTRTGYRAGPRWPVPRGASDNFEGMAIEPRPAGGWRFWLVSDDGHRIMARTLLIALDYVPPGHDKSPARGAGLSRKPAVRAP